MRGRIWPWFLLVLAFLPALLIHQPQPKLAADTNHVFTEVVFQNPGNVDPALASSPADWQVAGNLFQTLLDLSPSGAIVPGLASSASYRGRTVTIQLREARLANGQRVTADMVAEALARPLVAPVSSPAAKSLMAGVVGTTRFESGKSHYVAGIRVLAPDRLQLTLKTPATAAFLRNLANPVLAVVPVADQTQGGQNWQFTNLIGTSGYILTQWTPGDHLSFEKLSGSGPQAVDLVIYSHLNRALLAYQNGLVDAVPLDPADLSRLTSAELSHVQTLGESGVISLYINQSQTAHALPRVNIQRWVKAAFRGRVSALSGHYPQLRGATAKSAVVWVDQSNLEAVQLARSLAVLSHGTVTIRTATPGHLAAMAKSGAIGAYLGEKSEFAHSVSVALVPAEAFWLFAVPMPQAVLFPHQVLSWHSVE